MMLAVHYVPACWIPVPYLRFCLCLREHQPLGMSPEMFKMNQHDIWALVSDLVGYMLPSKALVNT